MGEERKYPLGCGEDFKEVDVWVMGTPDADLKTPITMLIDGKEHRLLLDRKDIEGMCRTVSLFEQLRDNTEYQKRLVHINFADDGLFGRLMIGKQGNGMSM